VARDCECEGGALLRDEWVELTFNLVVHCTRQWRGSVQDLSRNLPRSESGKLPKKKGNITEGWAADVPETRT